MNPTVFIDANVPIYAAGVDHPFKKPCARILRSVAEDPRPFITDSEVLQELLHRYLALGRWELGREVLRTFAAIMHGRIEPILAEDVLTASELADRHAGVSARDLVHAGAGEHLLQGQVEPHDVRAGAAVLHRHRRAGGHLALVDERRLHLVQTRREPLHLRRLERILRFGPKRIRPGARSAQAGVQRPG